MTKHPHPIYINLEEETYQRLKEIAKNYDENIENLINDYLDHYLVNYFVRNYKSVR